MRFIEKCSENEMVLAFLKAELDSPNFKNNIEEILKIRGLTRSIIDKANLDDSIENEARLNCLNYRGFKDKLFLFQGFPFNVSWERAYLNKKEIGNLKYANYPAWVKLSAGTRLVANGAKNIDIIQVGENLNSKVKAVEKRVEGGAVFSKLILVSKNKNNDLILVEGHTRATAYELAKDFLQEEIEVIVGYSKDLESWVWY